MGCRKAAGSKLLINVNQNINGKTGRSFLLLYRNNEWLLTSHSFSSIIHF
ncbi:hypothetical protein HNQ56_002508 [Anaerotaenia torta]